MKVNLIHICIIYPVGSHYWRFAWFNDSNNFINFFVVGMN